MKQKHKHYSSILVAFFPEKINFFRENKIRVFFTGNFFSWKTKTNSKTEEKSAVLDFKHQMAAMFVFA